MSGNEVSRNSTEDVAKNGIVIQYCKLMQLNELCHKPRYVKPQIPISTLQVALC